MKAMVDDVIQINDNNPEIGAWMGCLLIVDEVKPWGVLAKMKVPMKGVAYFRVEHGNYDVIGKAIFS